MKRAQVKQAWEQVIVEHLQPADQLSKGAHVEIRNDNGLQFGAREIPKFFQQNYLHQVFTHPYTPQENGHIESFHSIVSQALSRQVFWSLTELEQRLDVFYDKYNNRRLHASIAYLWPLSFAAKGPTLQIIDFGIKITRGRFLLGAKLGTRYAISQILK